jgi:hypothetical protein
MRIRVREVTFHRGSNSGTPTPFGNAEKAGMCHVPPTVQQLEIAGNDREPMFSGKLPQMIEGSH